MRKYTTEFSHGQLILEESNWSMTKDANKIGVYVDYDDAMDEMIEINSIINKYNKSVDNYNLGSYHYE